MRAPTGSRCPTSVMAAMPVASTRPDTALQIGQRLGQQIAGGIAAA